MPYRIGVLLYPIFAFAALRGRKSPQELLHRSGAVSEATAVRPGNIGITDGRLLHDAVKAGLVRRTPGGLYYVDAARLRRRRIASIVAVALVGVAVAGLLIASYLVA